MHYLIELVACSLNGLVKMQTAPRSLSDEQVSATLLTWLRECYVVHCGSVDSVLALEAADRG
jgi:hypothetical protein